MTDCTDCDTNYDAYFPDDGADPEPRLDNDVIAIPRFTDTVKQWRQPLHDPNSPPMLITIGHIASYDPLYGEVSIDLLGHGAALTVDRSSLCAKTRDDTTEYLDWVLDDSVDIVEMCGFLEPLSQSANVKPIADESPTSALDMQVGGDHYKDCTIQPIEFIEANEMGFLEGCVVKRLTRHNKPTGKGREDIEKAIHELQLLLQLRYRSPR